MEYVFSDVNDAFAVMWHRMMSDDGVFERQTRNGRVRESDTPVTTIFINPRHRVLFNVERDANPFFHLFEAIWMLAGQNDVEWLAQFNKRMLDYSDDGKTLVSAYGYRWSHVLQAVMDKIKLDRSTRRAYIPLFLQKDCFLNGKDVPCNVGISFHVRNSALDMTVFNRSNDMIWGAYGANYVHFGFLQEFVAAYLDVEVGKYSQISSNFHVYMDVDVTQRIAKMPPATSAHSPYDYDVKPSGLRILNSRDIAGWYRDAMQFIRDTEVVMSGNSSRHWQDPFFPSIAVPMLRAWSIWKKKSDDQWSRKALDVIDEVISDDWRMAGKQWLQRRMIKWHPV